MIFSNTFYIISSISAVIINHQPPFLTGDSTSPLPTKIEFDSFKNSVYTASKKNKGSVLSSQLPRGFAATADHPSVVFTSQQNDVIDMSLDHCNRLLIL